MRIKVHVKAGTSQEKIVKGSDFGADLPEMTVFLRAKAHDGEANAALVRLIAKEFKVPKTSVKIVRGGKSKEKIIEF